MKRWTFSRPPSELRQRKVRLDNVAIVPASLLPYKGEWQKIANRLPSGAVLICLPWADSGQRATLKRVAAILKAKGRQVATLSAAELNIGG